MTISFKAQTFQIQWLYQVFKLRVLSVIETEFKNFFRFKTVLKNVHGHFVAYPGTCFKFINLETILTI